MKIWEEVLGLLAESEGKRAHAGDGGFDFPINTAEGVVIARFLPEVLLVIHNGVVRAECHWNDLCKTEDWKPLEGDTIGKGKRPTEQTTCVRAGLGPATGSFADFWGPPLLHVSIWSALYSVDRYRKRCRNAGIPCDLS